MFLLNGLTEEELLLLIKQYYNRLPFAKQWAFHFVMAMSGSRIDLMVVNKHGGNMIEYYLKTDEVWVNEVFQEYQQHTQQPTNQSLMYLYHRDIGISVYSLN